jgi:hypothetical protein
LVVAELALAVALLAGAGLLINSFLRVQRVDPDFRPSRRSRSGSRFRIRRIRNGRGASPSSTGWWRGWVHCLASIQPAP